MIPSIQEAAQTAQALSDQPVGLTTGGWIFISIAWATIISVAVFCYRKVLQKAAEKRQQALLESPAVIEQMTEKK